MAPWSSDPGGKVQSCQESVLREQMGGHRATELAHCHPMYHPEIFFSTILFTSHLTSLTSTIAPSSTSMKLQIFQSLFTEWSQLTLTTLWGKPKNNPGSCRMSEGWALRSDLLGFHVSSTTYWLDSFR